MAKSDPNAERDYERYRSPAKQRLISVLKAMIGHEVLGVAPSAIARRVGTLESNVTSDLANLYLAGLAEPVPGTTHWRLSPLLPQIGLAMLDGVARAESRLADVRTRYTRDPSTSTPTPNR